MKINEVITRPDDDPDPSLWQRIKNLYKMNPLGTDDRKSRRNELDDIETRRAEKIRKRNKQDTVIRQKNKIKGAEVDQLLRNRRREKDAVEDMIADVIAQKKFGKDHHELSDLDRRNVIRTSRHLAHDIEAYPDLLDDPDYQADFKKIYPQGLVPDLGKNLDGTDADPDYSYLNPSKPKPEFKHPAFKTMYQYDEPGYDDNQQIRQIQDKNYTRSKVAKDNNINFEPRQAIYNLATSQANKERDARIATGKANIKNIEIQNRINKATTATSTPIDNSQKKFARDIQNEAGVGKITKYNTTVDVKPGETERQAAKFFPMNKGGKPKPLGVPGATPNQAFNLGLTKT